jgi:hypothetical protein
MAPDDLVETLLEGGNVEETSDPKSRRDVIDRTLRLELV